MAGAGQTYIDFNPAFFDEILRSAGVKALCKTKAAQALAIAQSTAPVDTGDYKRGLAIEEVQHAHRTTYQVVGHDPKTMLVESKTQNLARALKAVR